MANKKVVKSSDVVRKAFDKLFATPAYTNPIASYKATLAALELPTEETSATREQWEQIYEVTKNIRLLGPWKYFHESERVTLLLPDRDEPVYIVVMGSGDMTYGIGIYPGYDSLQRLLKITESPLDEENISAAFEQHCINLYFGDREELEPKDKAAIKELGLKFRGRNEWPYFRSMKPGYMPWHINTEEAKLVIAALQNFAMAAVRYASGDIKVDFEKDETLLQFYDTDSDMWYNTAVKMPPVPFMSPKLAVTDDLLIARLKQKKKSWSKLAFELSYIPAPIQEHKNQRPKVPRLAVLMDLGGGKPVAHGLNDGSEFIGKTITEMLSDYIVGHGRPVSITVSQEDTGLYIADFAEKLDIELVEDEHLSAISNMVAGIMNMMNRNWEFS